MAGSCGEAIQADNEAVAAGEPVGSYINEHPYGTGFFKWEAWTPGSEVKLIRNEHYWGTPTGLASVTFKVVPDSTVRLAELETGYAHIIDPVQPVEVAQIEQAGTSHVVRQSASGISYLGYHVEKPPFNDVRVRQAINMAIDNTALVDGIYDGYAVEAIGPLGPDIFGYTNELNVPEFNVEQAKQLLAEAGYPDGFKTSLWTYDDPQRIETTIVLQEALKQINIDAKVEVIELGAYLDKTANGDHEMFILGWSNPTGDADYGMYGLFHSSQFGTAGNRSFYANEKVDQLLDNARVEADENKRLALYKEAQQTLIDDAAVGFLVHSEYLIGVNNNVKGFAIDNASMYHLHDVTLAP